MTDPLATPDALAHMEREEARRARAADLARYEAQLAPQPLETLETALRVHEGLSPPVLAPDDLATLRRVVLAKRRDAERRARR